MRFIVPPSFTIPITESVNDLRYVWITQPASVLPYPLPVPRLVFDLHPALCDEPFLVVLVSRLAPANPAVHLRRPMNLLDLFQRQFMPDLFLIASEFVSDFFVDPVCFRFLVIF